MQLLTIEAIHRGPPYSINFDQSADGDARGTNLIKNVFGKPDPVRRGLVLRRHRKILYLN